MMGGVSLCMIVRNESARLGACLDAVRSLVHEVIVVDTGSVDETKAIAAAKGAKVFDFPWCDDFAAARNESVVHAACPWIFWLDADDRIDRPNQEKLRALFAGLGDGVVAYMMQCASVTRSGKLKTSHPLPRLFPNDPRFRWERRVHEQIVPSVEKHGGELRPTDIVIHHHGYEDPLLTRAKTERNLRLCDLECAERPFDAYTHYCRGSALADLGRDAEALVALNFAAGGFLPHLVARRLCGTMVRSYLREDSIPLALETLERSLSLYPGDPELLFLEVQVCIASGHYARAEQTMRIVLATTMDEMSDCKDAALGGPYGRYTLALACAAQGKFAEAEQEARAAIASDATYSPTWLVLADALAGQEQVHHVESLLADPLLPASARVQLRMYLQVLREGARAARDELERADVAIRSGVGRAEEWLASISDGAPPRLLVFLLGKEALASTTA
jgi:glycosyltransferase involved in cell wall biosynthesis